MFAVHPGAVIVAYIDIGDTLRIDQPTPSTTLFTMPAPFDGPPGGHAAGPVRGPHCFDLSLLSTGHIVLIDEAGIRYRGPVLTAQELATIAGSRSVEAQLLHPGAPADSPRPLGRRIPVFLAPAIHHLKGDRRILVTGDGTTKVCRSIAEALAAMANPLARGPFTIHRASHDQTPAPSPLHLRRSSMSPATLVDGAGVPVTPARLAAWLVPSPSTGLP